MSSPRTDFPLDVSQGVSTVDTFSPRDSSQSISNYDTSSNNGIEDVTTSALLVDENSSTAELLTDENTSVSTLVVSGPSATYSSPIISASSLETDLASSAESSTAPDQTTTVEAGGSGINSLADAAPLIAVAVAGFIFLCIAFGLLIYHCCRKKKTEVDKYSTLRRRSYIDAYNRVGNSRRPSAQTSLGPLQNAYQPTGVAQHISYEGRAFTFPRKNSWAHSRGALKIKNHSLMDVSHIDVADKTPYSTTTVPRPMITLQLPSNDYAGDRQPSRHDLRSDRRDENGYSNTTLLPIQASPSNRAENGNQDSLSLSSNIPRNSRNGSNNMSPYHPFTTSYQNVSTIDSQAVYNNSRNVLHKGRLSLSRGRVDMEEGQPQYATSPAIHGFNDTPISQNRSQSFNAGPTTGKKFTNGFSYLN